MASDITQEQIDYLKSVVEKAEPYPMELYLDMGFDDDRFPDEHRLASSTALHILLDIGYSENEVNPWKKKD